MRIVIVRRRKHELDVRLVIARRVRDLRFERGLTLREVGEKVMIARPIVGRIERGLHETTLPVLARLCRGLGVDVYDVARAIDMYDVDPLTGACTPKRERERG